MKMTYNMAPEDSLLGTVVQIDIILTYLGVPVNEREPWHELMARNGHLERIPYSRPARYVYDDPSLTWLIECVSAHQAGEDRHG